MDSEKLDMETALPGQIIWYESPCDFTINYGRILSIPDDRCGFDAEWYPSYDGFNGSGQRSKVAFRLKDGRFFPSIFVGDEKDLAEWQKATRESCEMRRIELQSKIGNSLNLSFMGRGDKMRIVTLTTKEPFLPLIYTDLDHGEPAEVFSKPGSARWEKHQKAIADCRDAMATEFEGYGENITVLNYTEKEREDVGKDCAVFVIEAVILVSSGVKRPRVAYADTHSMDKISVSVP